ncbi:MAG TPA: cysteine dioxygenase family protein [Phycisphaerales bacterium]|nr:cysteine dioxygenase family protein [Phycisphaerales bacterium]
MARMLSSTGVMQDPSAMFPKLAELISYLDSIDHRADLGTLQQLLSKLDVSRCDIASTCIFGVKGYRRNCISRSEWYELLACCWHSGDRTPIHDHRGVSCAFKVIEGEGTEIRFKETPCGLICPTTSVTMPTGYICAADDADIHQVANMQAKGTDLITLHIYSPPIRKMHTYDWGAASTAEAGDCYDC